MQNDFKCGFFLQPSFALWYKYSPKSNCHNIELWLITQL